MVFTAITQEAHTYKKGNLLAKIVMKYLKALKCFFMIENQFIQNLTKLDYSKSQKSMKTFHFF